MDQAAIFEHFGDVHITRDNLAHYQGLAAGKLLINRCDDCGHWIYPHRPLCPECWSWNVTPTEVSGMGKVFMFTLLHQQRDPSAITAAPIPVAAVELAEQAGLRYLARIVNCAPEAIALDLPVRLTWIEIEGQRWPAFEPVQA